MENKNWKYNTICRDKRDIDKAIEQGYGFLHYYPKNKDEGKLLKELGEINSYMKSRGYRFIDAGREYKSIYWRYSKY